MPSLTKIQTGFLEPQGAFELDPGTSSSPGLFFTGDTSTGMFSPSSGVLGFSTGSTQNALTILANGNIGIGTTNPENFLSVQTNSPTIRLTDTSSGSFSIVSVGSTGNLTFSADHGNTAADTSIKFSTDGNTERLLINSEGSVGIGATPETSLSTDTRQLKVGGLTYIRGTNGTSGKQNFFTGITYNAAPTSSQADKAIVSNASGDFLPAQYAMYQGGHRWRNATSATAGSDITWVDQMIITNTGNVGIGTNNPTVPLDVRGTVDIIKNISGNTSFINLVSPTNTALDTYGLTFNNPTWGIKAGIYGINDNNGNGAGSLAFYTNSSTSVYSERLRIISTGNVGIGTTNPGALLHTYGKIRFGNNASYYGEIDHDAGVTGYNIYNSIDTGGHIFQRNGVETLRIDSSGNLNVGNAASPASSNVHVDIYTNSAYDGWIRFRDESSAPGLIGFDHGGNNMSFYTDGANPALVISGSGNVGIGTTNPGYKLDVIGAFRAIDNNSGILFQEYLSGSMLWMDGSDGDFGGGDYWGLYAQNSTLWGVNYAGGENILNITSAGNVGIGTTNPSQKLDVNGTVKSTINIVNSLRIDDDAHWKIRGNVNSTELAFEYDTSSTLSDNNIKMLIKADGRVVINGTNQYPQILTIHGHNDLSSTSVNTNPTTTHSGGGGIRLVNNDNTGNYGTGIYFDHGSLSSAICSSRITTDNWGTDLRFYTHPTFTTNQFLTFERMRITAAGNVGIGTTNPRQQVATGAVLHVDGGDNGSEPALVLGNYTTNTVGNRGRIDFVGVSNSGNAKVVGSIIGKILSTGTNTVNGAITFETLSGVGPEGTERLRITQAGNVGIGSTNPAYNLDVNGNLRVTSNIINRSYTFNDIISYGSSNRKIVCRVNGTAAGSSVRVAVSGTSANVVVNGWFDIIANHSNDIAIFSHGGNYAAIYLRVTSGGDNSYDIDMYRGGYSSGDTGVKITVTCFNGETVTPTNSGTYNGPQLETYAYSGMRLVGNNDGSAGGDPGDLTVNGNLSKGSGTFKIDHPLESKKDTHHLVHSFTESPQADLIYRGTVTLVNGSATVNIDEVSEMTEGTFEVLCRNVQCFTTNESGWDLVKGSVSGNILTIVSQNTSSTDTISWMVIGERQDPQIYRSSATDANGRIIVEPLKLI